MSRDRWTDEEAAVQAECWDHGFILPYEALADEVALRREEARLAREHGLHQVRPVAGCQRCADRGAAE